VAGNNQLDIDDEEMAWLQNNSKRYLLNITVSEDNKKLVDKVKELVGKLDAEPEDVVFDRNDMRLMQKMVGGMRDSLECGVIPEYKRRGNCQKYIVRAEKKLKMLQELEKKITLAL